jgi:ABC-type amino acid transport substrate-binding protein
LTSLVNSVRYMRCAALVFCCSVAPQSGAAEPLSVCMAENNAPLSYRAGKEAKGLDVEISRAVAKELGRPLKVVLFESEYEKESSLSIEVNAMLSSDVCELASGFMMYATDLGPARTRVGRTPDYHGAKPKRQRPYIPLGTLVPSKPYQASAFTVVFNAKNDGALLVSLADLKGKRIGVKAGSVEGSILQLYRNGLLRSDLVSVARNGDPLASLDAGDADAAFVGVNKLDAYRLAHPGSTLVASSYLHRLRFNLGFVALEQSGELIQAVNRVIERAEKERQMEQWALASGTTLVQVAEPAVLPEISMNSLRSE